MMAVNELAGNAAVVLLVLLDVICFGILLTCYEVSAKRVQQREDEEQQLPTA